MAGLPAVWPVAGGEASSQTCDGVPGVLGVNPPTRFGLVAAPELCSVSHPPGVVAWQSLRGYECGCKRECLLQVPIDSPLIAVHQKALQLKSDAARGAAAVATRGAVFAPSCPASSTRSASAPQHLSINPHPFGPRCPR